MCGMTRAERWWQRMIRKSEADRIPLSPAAEDLSTPFVASAKTVYCSSGYDILNIDISRYGEVVARYFADRVENKFKGYLVGGKWSKIKLDNLVEKAAGHEASQRTYACSWMPATRWKWDCGDSQKTVQKFTGRIGLTYWENAIESDRYQSRVQSRWDRLQTEINALLRPAPDGFREWAEKIVSKPAAVLNKTMENLGGFVYRCTECSKLWGRKRRYRNKRVIQCPHCGAELTVNNIPYDIRNVTSIYLFDRCNDGTERWYERQIEAFKEYDPHTGKYEIKLNDTVLAVIPKGHQWGTKYYRDGQGYDNTRHYGLNERFRSGLIYPDFNGADEYMTEQQARCLKELAGRQVKINANKVITAEQNPAIEYLAKGRYDRLLRDSIEKDAFEDSRYFKPDADNLPDFMRINRQQCNRLRQINGSLKELEWLQYERMTGRKVSADDLEYFIKKGLSPNDTYSGTRQMLHYIPSPAQLRHYIEKQSGILRETAQQTVGTYSDYIRMAKAQGLNLSSEIFFKPKNLKAAHDECVRVAHEKEYETRAKEISQKFPKVPEILKDIQSKYTYESGEFAIIVPEKIEDIIAEGRALGHCIDTTDRYFDRIQNHVTYLVFLRHASARNMSWYTLEIEPGGTVRQQRTTGNRQNKEDTESYMPFIREWQKVVRQRISDEDKAAAARSREIRLAEYKELREKKETVRNGLLAGQLLVDVLEADLVEAM